MRRKAIEKKMCDSILCMRNVLNQCIEEYLLESILSDDVSDASFERFSETIRGKVDERLYFLKNDLKTLQKLKESSNDSSENATEK